MTADHERDLARERRRRHRWRRKNGVVALPVVEIFVEDLEALDELGLWPEDGNMHVAMRRLLDSARVIHAWMKAVNRNSATVTPLPQRGTATG